LESVRGVTATAGSNPALSASFLLKRPIFWFLARRAILYPPSYPPFLPRLALHKRLINGRPMTQNPTIDNLRAAVVAIRDGGENCCAWDGSRRSRFTGSWERIKVCWLIPSGWARRSIQFGAVSTPTARHGRRCMHMLRATRRIPSFGTSLSERPFIGMVPRNASSLRCDALLVGIRAAA
jgi:hypothetical protein